MKRSCAFAIAPASVRLGRFRAHSAHTLTPGSRHAATAGQPAATGKFVDSRPVAALLFSRSDGLERPNHQKRAAGRPGPAAACQTFHGAGARSIPCLRVAPSRGAGEFLGCAA